MEILFEGLFEILFEIIFEGAIGAASSKRVPLPFRILAAVIVFALFGGVIFLIVFAGINCIHDEELTNGIVLAVILFAAAALLAGVLIWRGVKFYKSRKE